MVSYVVLHFYSLQFESFHVKEQKKSLVDWSYKIRVDTSLFLISEMGTKRRSKRREEQMVKWKGFKREREREKKNH